MRSSKTASTPIRTKTGHVCGRNTEVRPHEPYSRMTNPHTTIRTTYDVPLDKFLETIDAPYTPAQRTVLVTDILNHWQESKHASNDEITDNEWNTRLQDIQSAADTELDQQWEIVGEWILSRRDVPGEDTDEIVQELVTQTELSDGEAIIAHQQFKRFHNDYDADYGFLGYTEYRHETDTDGSP